MGHDGGKIPRDANVRGRKWRRCYIRCKLVHPFIRAYALERHGSCMKVLYRRTEQRTYQGVAGQAKAPKSKFCACASSRHGQWSWYDTMYYREDAERAALNYLHIGRRPPPAWPRERSWRFQGPSQPAVGRVVVGDPLWMQRNTPGVGGMQSNMHDR